MSIKSTGAVISAHAQSGMRMHEPWGPKRIQIPIQLRRIAYKAGSCSKAPHCTCMSFHLRRQYCPAQYPCLGRSTPSSSGHFIGDTFIPALLWRRIGLCIRQRTCQHGPTACPALGAVPGQPCRAAKPAAHDIRQACRHSTAASPVHTCITPSHRLVKHMSLLQACTCTAAAAAQS